MALAHGGPKGALSEASKGSPEEVLRDYEPDADTPWRFGLPDYSTVNKAYFAHRSKQHAPGSLEAVVQKIVKNWEVESHHIGDVSRWRTMDAARFRAFSNGAGPVSAQAMADVGPYNMLLGECTGERWKASQESFESANDAFKEAFPEGFAFEVVEVFSPPPNVSFTWRHFGRMAGPFRGCPAHGELVEVVGHTIARVDEKLVILELQVFYDREGFLAALTKLQHKIKEEEEKEQAGKLKEEELSLQKLEIAAA